MFINVCRSPANVDSLTYRHLSFGALDDGRVVQLLARGDAHACRTSAAVGERGADIIIDALGIGVAS